MTEHRTLNITRGAALLLAVVLITIGAATAWLVIGRAPVAPAATNAATAPGEQAAADAPATPAGEVSIRVPRELVDRAGIVVAPVTSGETASRLRIPGVVEPNAYKQVVVTPIAGGRVTRVTAELGQRVRRGQAMAQVYSPELAEAQTRLIAVRAEFDATDQQVNRTRRLVEIGAASQQELEQVHALHAGHAAALAAEQSRLRLLGMPAAAIRQLGSGSEVTATIDVPAPQDGVVTERLANTGLNVDPSTRLFTVVDLTTVWVVADLYERDFARVRVGSEAEVTTNAFPGQTLTGTVSYIDPQVNPATRTARVRVEVPNARLELRLGMLAEMEIRAEQGAPAVLVPREAVQTLGDQHVVYVAAPGETGHYIERRVTLGDTAGDRVQVLSGLSPGESIVTKGSFYVRAEGERLGIRRPTTQADGATVTVTEKGFEPSRVVLAPGRATRITFTRTSEQTCATEIVFPALDLRKPLVLNQPVTVDVPAREAGEIAFVCGMDMLKGLAVFSM
jgi:RND family efflux transporter MFP subunit